MTTRYDPRTPRAALAALALVVTVALAGFIDFLATDYAIDQREMARAAATIQTALHEQRR